MRPSAFERIVTALQQSGRQVKHDRPRHAMAQCPAHEDGRPSLSIADTDSQALLHCFAGCHHEDIMAAIGLGVPDLFNEPAEGPYGLGEAIRYRYPDGRENWRSTRRKDFRRNDRPATLQPGGHALYRSDQIGDAGLVYVCEGEKDADAVASLGAAVVACPGSQSPGVFDWEPLHGREVVVIADRDDPGEAYAMAVADLLGGLAHVRTGYAKVGKDAADHIAAGLTLDDLVIVDPEEERRAAIVAKYPALDLRAVLDPNRPAREYVVAGLIPAAAAISLAAPAGTGKSLLALAVSLSIAQGRRAFAGLAIPRARRVLYVDMENTADDLAERFDSFGVKGGDPLGGLTYLSLPPLPPLDTRQGAAELMAILDAYNIGHGDLVVLDSLQRVIQGAENEADTMRLFYLHTSIELKRRGVTSLRLDNTGKDVARGSRGTSGKRDDVDLELVMVPDADDEDLFRIAVNKSRLSDLAPLTLTRFVDRDGLTRFSTADDPHRVSVNQAKDELDRLGVPPTASVLDSRNALGGRNFAERAIRTAVRERRGGHTVATLCAVCGYPLTLAGAKTHPGCEEH